MQQIAVRWSDPRSRFTALFEALVIDWLREANVLAISRRLQLSWAQVAGIQRRAVERGVARREQAPPTEIGVDETSFQKRHEYVTVVHDVEREVVVTWRTAASKRPSRRTSRLWAPRRARRSSGLRWTCGPYIAATRARVPGADQIVFGKFHIAKHLGDAVDRVRHQENRELVSQGSDRLKGSKYLWLQNPDPMSGSHWREFAPLRDSRLKVARAWTIKKAAMLPWGYVRRGWAERL